jgi:hypothetical protein
MKLITFRQGSAARPGLALDDGIGLDLLGVDSSLPPRWNEILPDPALMARVRTLGERARQQGELRPATALFALDGVTLLPPIPEPSKIVAVSELPRPRTGATTARRGALLFARPRACKSRTARSNSMPGHQVTLKGLAVVIGRHAIARERPEHRRVCASMTFRPAGRSPSQWFRGRV